MNLATMFLCLRPDDPGTSESVKIDIQLKKDKIEFTKTFKLLLLGTGESGKTTILKQMKILHINGFSNEEKLEKIPYIKQNIHESMFVMVTSSSTINPPVDIKNDKAKKSAEYILSMGPQAPTTWTNEYVDHIKTLWNNSDIQEVYKRSNEYQLIDSAQHFLDRIDDINNENFIPTVLDILYCRIMTVAISKIDFEVKNVKFSMYDVGGQRGHRKKWISVFDGIHAILFLIAASDFDQTLREDEQVNRLTESFHIFREVFWSRFVRDATMVVFLNKQDLLKRKIENGKRIENYFPDYANFNLPGNQSQNEYEKAKHYLNHKVLNITEPTPEDLVVYLARGITVTRKVEKRDAYVHFTVATDTNNIKHVFDAVEDLIFKRNIDLLTPTMF